jgi:hypothetical protein
MARTNGTSEAKDKKTEANVNEGENTSKPQGQMRKYFLPETEQVVEAESAEAAAKQANKQEDDDKGNGGK